MVKQDERIHARVGDQPLADDGDTRRRLETVWGWIWLPSITAVVFRKAQAQGVSTDEILMSDVRSAEFSGAKWADAITGLVSGMALMMLMGDLLDGNSTTISGPLFRDLLVVRYLVAPVLTLLINEFGEPFVMALVDEAKKLAARMSNGEDSTVSYGSDLLPINMDAMRGYGKSVDN